MNDEVNKVETEAKAAALAMANKQVSWVETNAKALLIGAGLVVAVIVGYLILR